MYTDMSNLSLNFRFTIKRDTGQLQSTRKVSGLVNSFGDINIHHNRLKPPPSAIDPSKKVVRLGGSSVETVKSTPTKTIASSSVHSSAVGDSLQDVAINLKDYKKLRQNSVCSTSEKDVHMTSSNEDSSVTSVNSCKRSIAIRRPSNNKSTADVSDQLQGNTSSSPASNPDPVPLKRFKKTQISWP